MKQKITSVLFVIAAMLVSGCNNGGSNPKPTDPVFDSFEAASESVRTKHNYTARLVNQFDTEVEPFVDFNFYNLSNGAMYDDYSGYYSGYIKQKDQGIVVFSAPYDVSTLILGAFVATNLDLGISDIYALAPEHILDKKFTYVESREAYVCSDFDAIAILADLAFGEYAELASAPEDFTAVFENNAITFTALFDIYYFDLKPIHAVATVSLTISKIEATHNKVLENYIANPNYVFVAPTEWDTGIEEYYFNEYYNRYYPPFIDGLSYSWHYGQSVSEGSYVVMVEDYYSGDLTSRYAAILKDNGFVESINPGYIEYVKIVEEEYVYHKYYVKMKFYAPTDKDASGMEYGYLFPNGVTSFKFLYKMVTKDVITNIGLLNDYISQTKAGDFLPAMNLSDDTAVKGFQDATSSDPVYAFLAKGKNSQFFNICPATKEEAIAFVTQYVSDLEARGFEYTKFLGQYWLADDYGSEIKIEDPESKTEWTEGTSLQIRIGITNKTIEHYESVNNEE